jgi:hypothetical protein
MLSNIVLFQQKAEMFRIFIKYVGKVHLLNSFNQDNSVVSQPNSSNNHIEKYDDKESQWFIHAEKEHLYKLDKYQFVK